MYIRQRHQHCDAGMGSGQAALTVSLLHARATTAARRRPAMGELGNRYIVAEVMVQFCHGARLFEKRAPNQH